MNPKPIALAVAVFACTLLPFGASADVPGRHPGYLHALADLRDADWNLRHRPGDAAVTHNVDVALSEVGRAINEARAAAADDGKNSAEPVRPDPPIDVSGRLHHVAELLQQARRDVAQEEDNPAARAIRDRLVQHIDLASRATERAIRDVEMHR